ncbi:conserved Plasmodium protein, unknown function [Plasmodium relictum]|uniref:Uncharacterized protein n=1 Tax=Plasmodium relictum TaxID=85471 RepID=A0A1J1HF54_PLARL|nr:conserved Plasmodium protein, unknown function [Plasmodium relictum]CRH04032.1 conserved Plasmodium protein, unknown function [Plasmodium relictum]
MNKVTYLKKFISNNFFFKDILLSDMKVRMPYINENYKRNIKKVEYIRRNINTIKTYEIKNYSFSFFLNNKFLIDNEKLSEITYKKKKDKILCFWNRSPGARYPKKANNGSRPDCRSLRKIRKRLKTGK